MTLSTEQLVVNFASACAERGLDLVNPFPVSAWNSSASDVECLPDFGRPDALAVLIGNSRRFWPVFLKALAADEAQAAAPHPLDEYVKSSVMDAASRFGLSYELRLGHAMLPRPIPIQRIAARVGMAALSPSHLSVHPEFGPWIALRAVVVFDTAPPALPVMPVREPCESCTQPCVAAFNRALGSNALRPPDCAHIASDWERWVAIRDACPVGAVHRYFDDQIVYHYTKRRTVLTPSSKAGSDNGAEISR